MKFKDFLNEGNLSPSIDDNDVLSTLESLSIQYSRTKNDDGSLVYEFDNRYSLKYDGSLFTLYRHGNRIHYENARNLREIEAALEKWTSSYKLNDADEIEDTEEDLDGIVAKMKDEEKDDENSDTSDDDEYPEEEDEDEEKDEDDEDEEEDKK